VDQCFTLAALLRAWHSGVGQPSDCIRHSEAPPLIRDSQPHFPQDPASDGFRRRATILSRISREGSLVTVLDDYPPTPTPVSLLYPQLRQLSPRVRVFIEWVSQVFPAGA